MFLFLLSHCNNSIIVYFLLDHQILRKDWASETKG